MSRLFCIPVVILVLACYTEIAIAGWAKCWNGKRSKNLEFGCYGVNKFRDLDKAANNVNSIVYHTSVLQNVEGNVFYRFRNSLMYLDLHNCQIETIDPRAFSHLVNLKNLTLWGNKLTMVSAEWFTDLTQLKSLDLSFNHISYIDEMAFTRMPKLENFFIDYNHMTALNWNVFTYVTSLKRARIGKNPWNWWFRAMISRQLDDQHVDYTSEWDDYNWINHVIRDCVENHQARNDDGSVLDCASMYLLRERSKISQGLYKVTSCDSEARGLYECTVRTSQAANGTVTPALAVRRILEGFVDCSQTNGVTVRMLNGKTLKLNDVTFSDTVDTLKCKIATALRNAKWNDSGITAVAEWPPERQKLWAYGCYLENGRTLSDYHLKSDNRIYLTLNMDE